MADPVPETTPCWVTAILPGPLSDDDAGALFGIPEPAADELCLACCPKGGNDWMEACNVVLLPPEPPPYQELVPSHVYRAQDARRSLEMGALAAAMLGGGPMLRARPMPAKSKRRTPEQIARAAAKARQRRARKIARMHANG
jgi:hypothetical protein